MPSFSLEGETIVVNERWRIHTYASEEFPTFPHEDLHLVDDVFPVPGDLEALFPAVGTDESRANLRGVCFDRPRGALVASNGHVLYHLTGLAVGERRYTVPIEALKFVQLLQRRQEPPVLASHYVSGDRNYREFVCFSIPGISLWARLVEEEFPDYPQVMPLEENIAHRLTIPRAPLIEALSGALPCIPKRIRPGDSKAGGTLFSIRPGEGILYYTSDTGDYRATFPAPGWPVGFHVGVSIRYLLDALKFASSSPETVEVSFTNSVSPIRLEHEAFTAIVMPMRVLDRLPDELQAVIDAQPAPEEQADLARREVDERNLSYA
jgi:hypothetical protein